MQRKWWLWFCLEDTEVLSDEGTVAYISNRVAAGRERAYAVRNALPDLTHSAVPPHAADLRKQIWRSSALLYGSFLKKVIV